VLVLSKGLQTDTCVLERVAPSNTTPFESERLSKAFAVLKVYIYMYLKNERLSKAFAVSKVIDI